MIIMGNKTYNLLGWILTFHGRCPGGRNPYSGGAYILEGIEAVNKMNELLCSMLEHDKNQKRRMKPGMG